MGSSNISIADNPEVLAIINNALKEDIGAGDYSSLSCIAPSQKAKAKLIFKDEGIAAGISIAHKILKINDPLCEIENFINDGDKVENKTIGFIVEGNAHALLRSERLLLNIMQRLSGIATITNKAVSQTIGTNAKILDTRKTTPNLRILEKWAVTVGGGFNHRIGLYDMIMLKDNHIDVSGGVVNAIQNAKNYLQKENLSLGIEVETRNIEEVKQALTQLPIQRIMLDNFSVNQMYEAVSLINKACETEASGGITLENIRKYADTGVDFISLGLLTHSYKSLDISFKIII